MCGISGMIGTGRNRIHNTQYVKRMVDILHHRGPDDNGMLGVCNGQFVTYPTNEFVATGDGCSALMGFARLSIRDLSILGHQPMIDSMNTVAISFNGEIYNADEIREELKAKNHKFRSKTDTEVILESYLEYGFEETVNKLNGMFAIIIADLNRRVYYLARDRVGIKPLYYTCGDNFLIYASEIKAILQYPKTDKSLSMEAIYEKMMYRGATFPSLFESIKWVEPGTYLIVSFDGNISKHRFFCIDNYTRLEKSDYRKDRIKLEEALKSSIRRQMISDVKVGCQLSGGVDSSLVCWYAKLVDPHNMNDTISIISPVPEFSEEKWIDEVDDKLGISGHKFLLDTERVFDTLPLSLYHIETILTQPNSLGILQISEHAKDYVTVLLSGEGADEMMGGYECWYEPLSLLWKFSKHRHDIEQYENFVLEMEIDPDQQWVQRILPSFDRKSILARRREILDSMSGDPYTRVMKYHFSTYLPELLLRQDKMSMANSIENRVPILDNEMINTVFQLPIEDLVREHIHLAGPINLLRNRRRAVWKTNCKYIFKEMCADVYGHDFAYRRKMGFPMPIITFMCSNQFKEKFYDEWKPKMRARGIFDADEVDILYKKQDKLSFRESEALWRALTFEMWAEMFVDN